MTAAAVPQEVLTIRDLLEVLPPDQSVPYQNDLFYGDPGAGKTFLLGTVKDDPSLWPLLLLDIDGGAATLRNIPKGVVEVKQVRAMTDLEDVHKRLKLDNHTEKCASYKGKECDCEGYFKSVAIDTGTELQKLDMKTVMQEQFEKKPDTTDKLVPSQREWGKSNERIRMIVRAFRDLPLHFFMTCHAHQQINERTGSVKYYPSLPGKLKAEIPGFFDVVGYLRAIEERSEDKVNIVRLLQVVPTDTVSAKDRTDALGDLIRNPSLSEMWKMIEETNVHKN